jgi:alanine dehydrogenase
LISSAENIKIEVMDADVLIGAVLVTGAKAPRLVSKELVSKMHRGSVIVDVSVDQGGCIETTRPSTHDDPVYTVNGVVHYTVTNMPGAYPRTSTLALTGKTLEYIMMLAKIGIHDAVESGTPLKSALNIHNGAIMHSAVAASVK